MQKIKDHLTLIAAPRDVLPGSGFTSGTSKRRGGHMDEYDEKTAFALLWGKDRARHNMAHRADVAAPRSS